MIHIDSLPQRPKPEAFQITKSKYEELSHPQKGPIRETSDFEPYCISLVISISVCIYMTLSGEFSTGSESIVKDILLGIGLGVLFSPFIHFPLMIIILPIELIIDRKKEKLVNERRKQEEAERLAYEKYNRALSSYQSEIKRILSRFPDLDKCEWDESIYNQHVLDKSIPYAKNVIINYIKSINYQAQKQWWVDLTWEEFEHEVAHWFERRDYKAKITNPTNDGGIDIILTRNGEKSYAQCKHYVDDKVDITIVRELRGVMADSDVHEGYIACLNGLRSKDAYRFAERNNIHIITLDLLTSEPEVTIDTEESSEYLSIGGYRIIKEMFSSFKEALEHEAAKNENNGVSILRIKNCCMLVISNDGDILQHNDIIYTRIGKIKDEENRQEIKENSKKRVKPEYEQLTLFSDTDFE